MNLQNQIQLMNNPQEFTRLCNAVFEAEFGDDFLPIDDDRSDRGNDGYIKSKEQIIAAHCFKRIQNQSIDADIKSKMVGDLRKAIELSKEDVWHVRSWQFVSNYPVNESIGKEVFRLGQEAGIDVSWRDANYLARVIQKADNIRAQFPDLEVSDVIKRLEQIKLTLEQVSGSQDNSSYLFDRLARNKDELEMILQDRPPGWEFILFGSILSIEKERLEGKWHDLEIEYAPKSGTYLDSNEGIKFIFNKVHDLGSLTEGAMKVFDPSVQIKAFGKPGQPGDSSRIIHMAEHTVGAYERLIDWAASVRSVSVPTVLEDMLAAAAKLAHTPALEFREFIEDNIKQISAVPAYVANPDPAKGDLNLVLRLTLTINDQDLRDYLKKAKKAKKKINY